MSFKVIETQEQFDEAVRERLKREAEKFKDYLSPEEVAEKYKDYLSPEAVEEKYEGWMSQEDIDKKFAGYISAEEAAEKDKKIKQYETDSMKSRIARKHGIPEEMAGRLTGEDEKALEKWCAPCQVDR